MTPPPNPRRTARCRTLRIVAAGLTLMAMALWLSPVALGQGETPVYINDSHRAAELLERASDQTANNVSEAARLYQELLDDYGTNLVPAGGSNRHHFVSVRSRVIRALRDQPALARRYRLIEQQRAEAMLEQGDLRQLVLTRSETAAGLAGLLRLAQQNVEAGRFEMARQWLAEASGHPEVTDGDRRTMHWLRGSASVFLDDADAARSAAEALESDPAGENLAAALRDLILDSQEAWGLDGVTPLQQANVTELDQIVAEAIWQVPLEQSLLARQFDRRSPGIDGTAYDVRRSDGGMATAAATVAGDLVFINQGHTILALNRITGEEIWRFVEYVRQTSLQTDPDPVLDMNVLTVEGDALVTITGHATGASRSNRGRVVCLDARTGERRWHARIDGIGDLEEHDGLFPHGAPVIAEGCVYILARKVTKQQLTSCYAMALDLDTGDLRWSAHIASSGGIRRSPRGVSTLVYREGAVYVGSPIGATARVNGDTGVIDWLQRFGVPITAPIREYGRRPWEMSAPVVLDDRVVVLQPNRQWVSVLDRIDGRVISAHNATTRAGWNSPSYLLSDGMRIYAVGGDGIRAFSPEQLEAPIWRLPAPATQRSPDDPVTSERILLRGRVQLVDSGLIVPGDDSLLIVDGERGLITHRLPVEAAGNPLAVDAQLLLAEGDTLSSYMSFTRAETMLRQRIASTPDDPQPALALLRLGRRVGDPDLFIEAGELAAAAINRASVEPADDSPRDRLLDAIEEAATTDDFLRSTDADAVFALADGLADTSTRRIRGMLLRADWLAERDPAQAVAICRQLLADQALAAAMYTDPANQLSRRGRAWATDRLRRLERPMGGEKLATERLRAAQGDADALQRLARELPLTDAGVQAGIAAADMLTQRGDPRAALAVLTAMEHTDRPIDQQQRLLGAIVSAANQAGWPNFAADALAYASRVIPADDLIVNDAAQSIRSWQAALAQAVGSRSALPRVGDIDGEAVDLPGVLVEFHDRSPLRAHGPTDRVLLLDDGAVSLFRLADLSAPMWTADIRANSVELLTMDDARTVIWVEDDPLDPQLIALDSASGERLWRSPSLASHLGDAVSDLGLHRAPKVNMANGRAFPRRESLPLVVGDTYILLRRTGAMLAIDAAAGPADASQPRTPRWTQDVTLDEVHHAVVDDSGVILIGAMRTIDPAAPQRTRRSQRMLVFDVHTGELIAEHDIADPRGVRWVAPLPLGRMVYGTERGVSMYDTLALREAWHDGTTESRSTINAWAGDDRVTVLDLTDRLRSVDRYGTGLGEAYARAERGDWDVQDLNSVQMYGDSLLAQYAKRVAIYDNAGNLAGADKIREGRDYKWLMPAQDRLVLVSNYQSHQGRGVGVQRFYRIYQLSPNGRLTGAPRELPPIRQRLLAGRLGDGWLLLSTTSATLAVPMPIDR